MNEPSNSRGILLVISSPSGAGKTTLARRLAAEFDIGFSVSYTTRKTRTGEVDGKDYHFVSNERFDAMVAAGEFAEWALVHGNRYGTSIASVRQTIESGMDCLFDVDFQGGRQIRKHWPSDSILCFILPPSMEELERRLRRRATDAPDVIEKRLAMACKELEHYDEYDFLVVNDDLSRAYDQLRSILVASRCSRVRKGFIAQQLLSQAATRSSRGT
jgi:guanylate kinase